MEVSILLVLVVVWLLPAIISAAIAGGKNRSGFGWFLLGLLFSYFAILFIAVASPIASTGGASAPALPSDTATKKCPRCAEEVKAAALVCRFCGFEFPAPTAPWRLPPEERTPGRRRIT